MTGVQYPKNWKIESLAKLHDRKEFKSENFEVDQWLSQTALQSQSKRLTNTKVLLNEGNAIVGYW